MGSSKSRSLFERGLVPQLFVRGDFAVKVLDDVGAAVGAAKREIGAGPAVVETEGCVLVEANACGIPVISSKVGGVPEFVNEKTGILVEKNNVEDLYLAMEKMLLRNVNFETPEVLHQQIKEKYSPEKIAEAFSEVYEFVLKQ